MSIVVPPRGTRGTELPKPVRTLMRVMEGPFHFAFQRFGDRMRIQGRPLVMLETVGGKTGVTRHTVLGAFPEMTGEQNASRTAERWVVVASNGGSARHPGWFLNLARQPDRVWIVKGNRRIKVRPETLGDAEREQAWKNVTSLAPGYGKYLETTDRTIPIVRLTAVEDEG
jgi:deazaflavin-dependent oxidoreductase (nitroreductase family)